MIRDMVSAEQKSTAIARAVRSVICLLVISRMDFQFAIKARRHEDKGLKMLYLSGMKSLCLEF